MPRLFAGFTWLKKISGCETVRMLRCKIRDKTAFSIDSAQVAFVFELQRNSYLYSNPMGVMDVLQLTLGKVCNELSRRLSHIHVVAVGNLSTSSRWLVLRNGGVLCCRNLKSRGQGDLWKAKTLAMNRYLHTYWCHANPVQCQQDVMTTTILLMVITALATASYFVLGRKRRAINLHIDLDNLPEIDEALPLIAGLTDGEIHWRNSIDLFQDGAIFDAMADDINGARQTIHFETFVWKSSDLEKWFVALLCRKAKEGLKVRIVVDALGAMSAGKGVFARLHRNGVEVAEYRPIRRLNIRRFNNRTHRKLLILDGEIGYTFGHGIADEWLGRAEDEHHWRDTGVRLRGTAVHSLQSIFLQDWMEADGYIPIEKNCFPVITHVGPAAVHVVSSTGDGQSLVALLYKLAIASARQEIIIQNPYFTPDPQVPQLLRTMAERGVAVHLMVPGEHTDSAFVRRAGCRLYMPLLRAGVHLYEYQPTLLHQKIVVIDGKWSHVGSTNFDQRSLALNAEIGVGILDKGVARQLQTAFERDLKESRELTLTAWRSRGWYRHFLDWCAYQLHGQM